MAKLQDSAVKDERVLDEVDALADKLHMQGVIDRPTNVTDGSTAEFVRMERVTTVTGADYTRVTETKKGSAGKPYVLAGWPAADDVLRDVVGEDVNNPNHPDAVGNNMSNQPYTPPLIDYSSENRAVVDPGVKGRAVESKEPASNAKATDAAKKADAPPLVKDAPPKDEPAR